MPVTRDTVFYPADRYRFDFGPCSYLNGWAQVDTRRDAPYHGTWTNPTTREILSYVEGDVTRTRCDTDDEYIRAIRELVVWNEARDDWLGIDPGLGDGAIEARFRALGLADLLH